MRPHVVELARLADCWVSCYPNAGLPNAFGQYDELPAETANLLREFAESGLVNILGGCCGTTPGSHCCPGRGGQEHHTTGPTVLFTWSSRGATPARPACVGRRR